MIDLDKVPNHHYISFRQVSKYDELLNIVRQRSLPVNLVLYHLHYQQRVLLYKHNRLYLQNSKHKQYCPDSKRIQITVS